MSSAERIERTRPAAGAAWITVLDSLSLLLAALALLVLITGGFKTTVAGVRLSVTSPIRLLAWFLAIASVRHIVLPRPSILDTVSACAAAWPRSESLAAVLPPFLVTRLAVLFVGFLAVFAFGLAPGNPLPAASDAAAQLMHRWDAAWYVGIATEGYRYAPGGGQQNYAFFPLYPMLVRAGGLLSGGHYLLSGFVVSMAAFLGALVYVHRLARAHCRNSETARWAVTLLAMYPFALYFGAVYTESTFLLCVAGALYHLLRGEDARSAAFAFLAGLTRPNGFLLTLPLAALLAARVWPRHERLRVLRLSSASVSARGAAGSWRGGLAAVIAPVLGMLVYSAYVHALTGDAFAWVSVQSAWGRHPASPLSIITGPLTRLADHGLLTVIAVWPFDTINAMGAGLALALLWPVTRRYGLALGLFVALNLLAPLLNGGVVAAGRYTAVLFPVFFWLADRVPTRQLPYWTMAFGMGQALAAALFFTWRPMF